MSNDLPLLMMSWMMGLQKVEVEVEVKGSEVQVLLLYAYLLVSRWSGNTSALW